MPVTMPVVPDRVRLSTQSRPVGVDREARVIRGYVVAQEGPFKSEGRGEFDALSLQRILDLWPAQGLKSRFAHPTESSDGLGRYLGRARAPYLGKVVVQRDGQPVELQAVRADLYLDASAFKSPEGDLGSYLLDLAESDPDALSSSLVLSREEEYRLEKDGTRMRSQDGEVLPPLWRPKRLHASDVVDEGDAVDGFLSSERLDPLRYTRDYLSTGEAILNKLFAGQPRDVVQSRLMAYLNRYLDRRYGSMQGERLGPTLGSVLNGYIEAMVTEEQTREGILEQMGQAAGIPTEEVSAIVAGENVDVSLPVLQAFAGVLGCSLGELVIAAEQDGMNYSASQPGEDPPAPEDPQESPVAGMASRAKPSVLRRRLALKEKSH